MKVVNKVFEMKRIFYLSLVVVLAFLNVARGESAQKENPLTVSAGNEVTIEYTLTLEDKTTVDSNAGGEPYTFIQGEHHIVPGLEKALEGLKVGDQKEVKVKPEDGFGLLDPGAVQEVDKARVPPEALVVGTPLEGRDPEGIPVHAKVLEIKESTVVLDLNHPLAGKTLIFAVKILGIQAHDPPNPLSRK